LNLQRKPIRPSAAPSKAPEEEIVSVAVTHTESSELTPIVTNAKLQSGCVPDEALALIIAAQITEEFRDFLLVIAFQPGSLVGREAGQVGSNRK
jgi:hypothetical protein